MKFTTQHSIRAIKVCLKFCQQWWGIEEHGWKSTVPDIDVDEREAVVLDLIWDWKYGEGRLGKEVSWNETLKR